MLIIEDLKHKCHCYYEEVTPKLMLRVFVSDGTSAMILYRLTQWLQKWKLGPLASFVVMINKLLNGCVIGRHAQFGPGFVLMHPVGVIINGGVKGGKNIVIESGVVIGAARNGLPVKVPCLGDDVFIGSGAKIIGELTVADHTQIGANSVVVRDVPEWSTALGIPAKPIPRRRT